MNMQWFDDEITIRWLLARKYNCTMMKHCAKVETQYYDAYGMIIQPRRNNGNMLEMR